MACAAVPFVWWGGGVEQEGPGGRKARMVRWSEGGEAGWWGVPGHRTVPSGSAVSRWGGGKAGVVGRRQCRVVGATADQCAQSRYIWARFDMPGGYVVAGHVSRTRHAADHCASGMRCARTTWSAVVSVLALLWRNTDLLVKSSLAVSLHNAFGAEVGQHTARDLPGGVGRWRHRCCSRRRW